MPRRIPFARIFLLVVVLTTFSSSVARAQEHEDMPSVYVTRVFAGGGPIFGHGDVPTPGPIESKPVGALGIELSRAIADHVEVGVGVEQMWSKSFRKTSGGERAGRPWSVLTGYVAVHYHVVDASLVGVAVGPVISFSRRELFTVPADTGDSTTLVSSGGPGAGFETRVAFPGGRCKGTFSLEAAMQYTAFRWLADRTRLDQRPLVFTVGVIVRH
jgi:hypothetical protein